MGKKWFSVPGAGRFLAMLQSPMLVAGLASAFAVFLVLSGDTGRKRRQGGPPSRPRDAPQRRWRLPGLTLWLLLAAVALMVRR